MQPQRRLNALPARVTFRVSDKSSCEVPQVSGLMARLKNGFLRLIEFSLYGHGVLHFAELGLALYEEAYMTASLAGFGALTMILGAVFLGRVHHH